MDKDKYQKFLDQHIIYEPNKKWLGSTSDAFIEVIKVEGQCGDCGRQVKNRAPIRTHKIIQNDQWLTYCKDCGNYQNPESGKFEQNRLNYNNAYRLTKNLKCKVDDKKSNDTE